MNFILGGGIVGLLAKKILGDSWDIIPFKRSRYYEFEIPWADNFIRFDKQVDDFMKPILPPGGNLVFYKSPFSYAGQLIFNHIDFAVKPYLEKVYGEDVPNVAGQLLKTDFMVYPVTVQSLYKALQDKYVNEIRTNLTKYGEIEVIDAGSREIRFKGKDLVLQYDRIVSTIPLNALYEKVAYNSKLSSSPIVYYHIATTDIDLEGAQQCLVCDKEIDFFKVQMLNKTNYLFWCKDVINEAFKYFGLILGYKFNIMEVNRIAEALPLGNPPDLSEFESKGIFCVGSNAQWDDFMDISSCIKRLMNIST